MRIVSTAAAAVLLMMPVIGHTQSSDSAGLTGRPIRIGTSYQIQSIVLSDTRELNVWLPSGYDKSSDRYPVVYLLDGALDQDFQHIAGLGHLASLSWTYGPVIIVGVQTKERRAELTSRPSDKRYLATFPNSGGADRFRQFLRREVIPFVEKQFRVGQRRAIMGESLAGLFVVDTLLNDPTLFGDYVAISPSLWWDDRLPLRRLGKTTGSNFPSSTRLYLAMADEGGTMQDGVNRLRAFLATKPSKNIAVRYADFRKTATHSTIYHRSAEESLRWLYPAPPYPSEPTPWYMTEGALPPASKSR